MILLKRTIAFITSLVLILSILYPFNENVVLANDFGLEFSIVKNTTNHKTFDFHNGETLEEFNENDETYYIANTEEDSFKIVNENDVVSVINLQNNKVVETYTATEEMPENQEITAYALIEDPGNGSKYRYVRTKKMSTEIISTSVSVVAGVIAAFAGSPVTGIIVTIATAYVGAKLKKLYWKEHYFEYQQSIYKYKRTTSVYYKYHDYTGHLGSTNTYLKHRIGYR